MALLRRLGALWDHAFFQPVDARSLGLFRLAYGITVLLTWLALTPEIAVLMGPDSPIFLPERPFPLQQFSIYDLFPADLLTTVHLVAALPILAFAVGFGGRVSNLLTLLLLMSLHHGNPLALNGGDRLIRLFALYLLMTPSTRALSVDAWLARRRGRPLPRTVPVTTHRLVQLQVCWMYLHTGITKSAGTTWWDGTATYYALAIDKLGRFPSFTEAVLLGWAPFVYFTAFMTWVTLVWELAFPLLVLWRPTRVVALLTGILVHTGIAMLLVLAPFSFTAMSSYLLFCDPDRVGGWVGAALTRLGGAPVEGAPQAAVP